MKEKHPTNSELVPGSCRHCHCEWPACSVKSGLFLWSSFKIPPIKFVQIFYSIFSHQKSVHSKSMKMEKKVKTHDEVNPQPALMGERREALSVCLPVRFSHFRMAVFCFCEAETWKKMNWKDWWVSFFEGLECLSKQEWILIVFCQYHSITDTKSAFMLVIFGLLQ